MLDQDQFPSYIHRPEPEKKVREMAQSVQRERETKAMLLYGVGGVGKSHFLRHISKTIELEKIIFLEPIDMDDLEFWSLTNIERQISEIPETGEFFEEYKDYISQIHLFERERVGHETALAYIRKGDDIFLRSYQQYIENSGLTPVLILDTLETIRGTDILNRLFIWLKRLPGTLIILAGRPMRGTGRDPIIQELEDAQLPYEPVLLGEFTREESLDYLKHSDVASGLTNEEIQRIALLSQGHPLWLSLAVYYTRTLGVPDEIGKLSFKASEQTWPYQNGVLQDEFIRRLVIPFRQREFWHEAVLRLGIVRQRLSQELWQALMEDQDLPIDVASWDEAWEMLLKLPWIRPRANRQYITLQDALAEELARRIIPIHDYDKKWRKALWTKIIWSYEAVIDRQQREFDVSHARLEQALKPEKSGAVQADLASEVLEDDRQAMEIFLLRTTHLYYQLLVDYKKGCEQFVELFDRVAREHLFRFIEMLWSEMERFIGRRQVSDPLGDIIYPEVLSFQQWYQKHPVIQFQIITRIAKYLYTINQAAKSEQKLNELWGICQGNVEWEYTILNLRANARMLYPEHVTEAEDDFKQALERTRAPKVKQWLKNQEGQALKELGFYYRNTGDWKEAATYYLEALRITPLSASREKAAIQSQFAYVQALRGLYQEAYDLVDSALNVRRGLKRPYEVGMALSVKGEVCRYARDFHKAWNAYLEAEDIFEELDDWGWLWLVRQEMAICLFQAFKEQILLPDFTDTQAMLERSRELIINALDYCREYSRRSYPSALNRASRIISQGFDEPELGLSYLDLGIQEAEAVADGWFWFANLIEFAELSYKLWQSSGENRYREAINEKTAAIEQARKEYNFPDLQGRWEILCGELKANEAQTASRKTEKARLLREALEHFKQGYPSISLGYIGSHGAAALPEEAKRLENVMMKLNQKTRDEWLNKLETSWREPALTSNLIEKDRQAASLLALLTNLYAKFHLENGDGR